MTFEDVEDKIIAEIKAKMGYVRTIETYAGQLEGEIAKIPAKFPAAFVVYGGSSLEWIDGPNHNDKPKFKVLVAAKDLRGQKSARKDDNKGCYRMINDVLTHLTNQTFGLAMEKLTPVSVMPVFITKTIAVYGIDFETNFDTTFSW